MVSLKDRKLLSRIGLISAVPFEGGRILSHLKRIDTKTSSGLALYKGRIHNKPIIYGVSGIGKTNASRMTTTIIERFSPRIIINFGVGGAYPSSGLGIGDIAIAEEEIYGDEGILFEDGLKSVELIGFPLLKKGRKKYFNEFPLDKRLIKKAVDAARTTQLSSPITVKSGHFLTLSTCTGTLKRARELENKFHAICENMEGAAVTHVCTSYGIPVVEIRGISNAVEDRDRKKWDIKLAADNCQKVVMEFLRIL
jgi:futalosine hydrolase